jgi:hypothetical protein
VSGSHLRHAMLLTPSACLFLLQEITTLACDCMPLHTTPGRGQQPAVNLACVLSVAGRKTRVCATAAALPKPCRHVEDDDEGSSADSAAYETASEDGADAG